MSRLPHNRPIPVPIHREDAPIIKLIISVAAPRPILGPLHQAAGDRVLVGVIQLLDQRVASMNVEIVAASVPNRFAHGGVARPVRQWVGPQTAVCSPIVTQPGLAMKTDVLFERTQQGGDVSRLSALSSVRQKKNVHMLRHHHVPYEANVELHLQPFLCGDDDSLHPVVMENAEAAIAGDGPEVDVTGLVESS